MPWVEQTLTGYLSPGAASSLKAPVLPTKPLRVSSALVGKGYTAAGQAGACLHTMAVQQAYQADLLKELDEREQISLSDVGELRRTADLALRATKETTHAIGRSMAVLVAAERHLWLTLSDMKEKDRVFLMDALLAPSGLFDLRVVLQSRKSSMKRSWRLRLRTVEGGPCWGRAGCTALHGVRLSSAPSGDRSANPVRVLPWQPCLFCLCLMYPCLSCV